MLFKKIFLILTIFFISEVSAKIYLEPTLQFKPWVEVAIVYIEYNDQILLLHRQDNKSQGNKWGLPGGKIERNETPMKAVIRETLEETGLDISQQYIETIKAIYVEYDEKNHFVCHTFRTKLHGDPGTVTINFKEHKGFTWVKPVDALKMNLIQDEEVCILKDYFSE